MKNGVRLIIYVVVIFGISYRCDHIPNQVSDENISDHPVITGRLMNPDNKSPSSGALVKLYSHNELVSIGATTKKTASIYKKIVQTRSDGTFAIDSCPVGLYTIECTAVDGNAVRIDSVIVADPKMTTDVSVRQLKSSGAVRGKITVDNGNDPSNVFILAFGSERFVQTKTDGTFLMDDLPYGDYTLKIIYIPGVYSDSKEISVTVKSGETADIGTVDLSSVPICAPENLAVTLDSAKMCVNLKWDSCNDGNIVGYYIHRYNVNEIEPVPGKEPNPATRVTINKDPVSTNYFSDYLIEMGEQYSYWVSAVTTYGRQGPMAGPVTIVPKSGFYSIDSIVYTGNRLPVAIRWKNTNSLQVATVEKDSSSLGLDFYNDKLILDHHNVIVNSHQNYSQIQIRDDYVLFTREIMDKRINCYSINGTLRYSCTLPFTTLRFYEKDDTLYFSGVNSMMMYNTAGTHLKDINQSPLFGTDGNLYLFNEDRHLVIPYSEDVSFLTKGIQLEYQETKRTWLWYASARMYFTSSDFYGNRLIDVNSGWCVLSSMQGWVIYDNHGTLRARLPVSSSKYDFSAISVNSNGAIAILNRYSTVYVCTPKN
jgi:hypothetical protein